VLRLLQDDARISNAELARRVHLSPPGLLKRLRKLERDGVVLGYATLLRREAVGLDLLCFVQVTLAHHQPETVAGFSRAIAALPEVLECHHLTGDFDYLMKVVVRNHQHLQGFLVDALTPVPGVDRIRTSIVLSEVKAGTALPLGHLERSAR
jgi:DNA-binding Lrp family transcriptional regulator